MRCLRKAEVGFYKSLSGLNLSELNELKLNILVFMCLIDHVEGQSYHTFSKQSHGKMKLITEMSGVITCVGPV